MIEFEIPKEPEAKLVVKFPPVAVWEKPAEPKHGVVGYVVALAIGLVFGFLLADSSLFRDSGGGENQDGKHEQVDPDNDKTAPKLANAWVLLIEESSQRTPQVARILGNSTYWDSLAARKIKWRLYDKDSPEVKSYTEAAEKVGYPAVLILTTEAGQTKGTLVAAKPCPPTTDSLDEFIRKVTGL